MKVDNLLLLKQLGEGSFGKVYLTNYIGDNKLYATKIYDREPLEKDEKRMKYFNCEINFLNKLNHPNIVKFIDAKKTKNHFYLVTEYCNGGELEEALEEYKKKYGKPFSEEIVQYLMRQILDAFNYLHNAGVMHRDIKLENILLHYESEEDKKNLNLMKAIPKIIDFGFAIYLGGEKNGEADTMVGNQQNMAPTLVKKYCIPALYKSTYNIKADIWSLGSICYEMLIGEFAFNSQDMDELIYRIEKGDYSVPTDLSEEVVSFINAMLQYQPEKRLTCAELLKHRFLTQNVNTFHKIPLNKVSNKLKGDKLVINTKKNNTIWAIFNENDEAKLSNIDSNLHRVNTQKEQQQRMNNQMSQAPQPLQQIQQMQSCEIKQNPNNNFNQNYNYNNFNQFPNQNPNQNNKQNPFYNPNQNQYQNPNQYQNSKQNQNPNQYSNPNPFLFPNQNSNQNQQNLFGPVLPSRQENPNPVHINQKFDVEFDYVFSGNIYCK